MKHKIRTKPSNGLLTRYPIRMTATVAKHMLTKLIIAAALALSFNALEAIKDPPENKKLLNR